MSQPWIGYAALSEQNFRKVSNSRLLLFRSQYLGRHPTILSRLLSRGRPIRSWWIFSHIYQQQSISSRSFFCRDIAVHLIYLHDLYCFVRLYVLSGITKSLYPIIDGDMTTFKKSANRTKTKPFEIKFKCLPLDGSAFADMLYRMSIYPQDLHLWRCRPLTMPSFLQSLQPHFWQVTMSTPPKSLIMCFGAYYNYIKLTMPSFAVKKKSTKWGILFWKNREK